MTANNQQISAIFYILTQMYRKYEECISVACRFNQQVMNPNLLVMIDFNPDFNDKPTLIVKITTTTVLHSTPILKFPS